MDEIEIINSVKLTDEETGRTYELDFDREALKFAQRNGFALEDAIKYPVIGMPDLFYYSFRRYHKNVPREKTDKMVERWGGGLPEKLAQRLMRLYQQAESYNAILAEDKSAKNSGLTLEL